MDEEIPHPIQPPRELLWFTMFLLLFPVDSNAFWFTMFPTAIIQRQIMAIGDTMNQKTSK
jgi:hypothetical protein